MHSSLRQRHCGCEIAIQGVSQSEKIFRRVYGGAMYSSLFLKWQDCIHNIPFKPSRPLLNLESPQTFQYWPQSVSAKSCRVNRVIGGDPA